MPLYSKVESPQDIKRINCIIRDEILNVESEAQLSELKKRSDYLCTLTYSPFWQKKFSDEIEDLRQIAIEENRVTVKECNIVAKYKNFNKEYHPWKKEIDINQQLKELPQRILDELLHSVINFELEPEILEQLRRLFCDIRKAMVLTESEKELEKLIKSVDLISLLPYLHFFNEHFDNDTLALIDSLINKESERTIKLANIICEVYGYSLYFGSKVNENYDASNLDDYLKELLEEEKKSDTYIPTEQKYKKGAKVIWLVYEHKKRKRDYAKRIYIPSEYRNLKVEGPGWFENRFKNRVWGIKITYESKVKATTIHIRGKEIKLPERWIKREKVIPLPQEAINIRILDEKPKSAMDIA